ncbi:carnitinyl-CoA dehydratase [Marinomonas sp. SBI22]|uniref:enoyl-CoA hydratase-related protein n=1 Tax=unclassified Marinomonas TaxID=196814 RepID=UPI0005FA164A|nr:MULTISPECIES: enoyl-CoA hydratase-related protein [unclassified Marinomonas]KJZ14152.1 carnitinyl-CoA dehydratase [Marinomonas sp. S3726]KZM44285.1 carnitinyl-CoA dehydratase [Marinomonas sp. SBI22]KZM45443.1 carnitinyl-CoA dehydratase [Marinomonas sp. SBI8L]
MSQSVSCQKIGRVLEITLNRPPVNAINLATSTDLYQAFKRLQEDDDLYVGIITNADCRYFSAGWDLKEFADKGDELMESADYDLGPGGLGGMSEFWGLKKPVIAAVTGSAIGGGFEMLLSADVIIAAKEVEFWLPEAKLGFLPDGGGIQQLPKRLPYNLASELILTGRKLGMEEAKHHGLVSQVLEADQVLAKAHEMAAQIAEAAPLPLQAMKEIMALSVSLSVEETFVQTRKAWKKESDLPLFEKMLHSEDYLEGSRAFSEKRPPEYKGR